MEEPSHDNPVGEYFRVPDFEGVPALTKFRKNTHLASHIMALILSRKLSSSFSCHFWVCAVNSTLLDAFIRSTCSLSSASILSSWCRKPKQNQSHFELIEKTSGGPTTASTRRDIGLAVKNWEKREMRSINYRLLGPNLT